MPDTPNIVMITTHDSGTHFGCYGVETVDTPAIDSLAESGVLLDAMFCTSPVCSPSRASCLTGQYPQTNGMMGLLHSPWDWRMRNPRRHMASLLRNAGYKTALFGFEHEHPEPSEIGFETVEARSPLPRANEVAEAFARHIGDRTANRATGGSDDSRPLYAQIGFWETHRPWDRYGDDPDDRLGVTVPTYLEDNDEWRRDLAGLQGVIHTVDEAVAIILEALDAAHLADNTIVVFNTDHGIEFPRAKWFCYDPGIRIASVFRWPGGGVSGGRRCSHLVSNVDLLPTLFDLAGIETPEDTEGISFADSLTSPDAPPTRQEIFGMFLGNDNRYIRTERYKLIRNFGATRYPEPPIASMDERPLRDVEPVELYDLAEDPDETNNIADEAHDTRNQLDAKLFSWLEQVDDPILSGPTPTPAWERAIEAYRGRSVGKEHSEQ